MSEDPIGKGDALLAETDRQYSAGLAGRLLGRLPSERDIADVCDRVWLQFRDSRAPEHDEDPQGYLYAIAIRVMWALYAERGVAHVPLEESLRLREEMERASGAYRTRFAAHVDDEAAAWFERLRARETEERQQFLEWLRRSAVHVRRFLELTAVVGANEGAQRAQAQ